MRFLPSLRIGFSFRSLATAVVFLALTSGVSRAEHDPNGTTVRADSIFAASMQLAGNWQIDGALPQNALLISLQGLANQGAPRLYFTYPEDWVFTFTASVKDYYDTRHGVSFEEIGTVEDALERFHEFARGYVVWDPDVRTSLTVAFTVAGLEHAVVASPDQIELLERYGLGPVADFRGRFDGMSDYEIYSWAYETYGPRCSKEVVVWMGGVGGNSMEPGVADYGIYRQAFFTDLSADPKDTLEYNLASRIMDDMEVGGLVMGWHSYAKDTEGMHVTLVSQHALRMEGLNSLPNASFSTQIPVTPGYQFTNQTNVSPDTTLIPEEKVYITAVQTDGLGLGAWLRPGRGTIPYAWEVTMNWSWLFPAQLQYFYEQATPNDYFVGMLSGPGYMYPKAVPEEHLPELVDMAREQMETLDLHVFEIMDYSEGNRLYGNLDLPKSTVDVYYEHMPNAIGFVNGYGPAHTNAIRDGVPFLSYEYYLSEHRPVDEAVADLRELIRLNPKRPYFLLMHVREWRSIEHVKEILDQLGPQFELVPLDVFMKLAAANPTFKTHYLSDR